MSILNLWKKQASSFYSTSLSLSWAYSWGRSPLWKGKKVLMGKWGGGGVRVRVWHVSTAMCCFPAYSHQTLLFSLPDSERTTVRTSQKQWNKRKYTPNTHVLNRPFWLVFFVSPFNFRPCDVTSENCFFQISSYPRVYACTILEKTEGEFPWEHHVA